MQKCLYEKYPLIVTDDIVLRKITKDDIDSLFEIYNNEKVMNSIPANIKSKNVLADMIEDCEQDFINEKHIRLGISLPANQKEIVGIAKIFDYNKELNMINIGYIIKECFWNRGIATNTVKVIIDFLFTEIGINRIQASVLPKNIGSQRVLVKNNFQKEGLIRQGHLWEGKGFVDIFLFSLLKIDYQSENKI